MEIDDMQGKFFIIYCMFILFQEDFVDIDKFIYCFSFGVGD